MNKILSIITILISLMCTMPLMADTKEDTTPVFSLSNVEGKAGDIVEVDLNIGNNPGITSLKVNLEYPESALKLTNIEYKTLFSSAANGSQDMKSPFTVSWFSTKSQDENNNGVIATFSFEILEGAEADSYPINLSYNEEDIFNSSFTNIHFETGSSIVKIQKPHKHELQKIEAKNSTCVMQGNNEYYFCAGCTKYFKTAEANIETTEEAEKLPLAAHQGGKATCIKKAVCDVCKQEYGDYVSHQYIEKADDKYLKSSPTCTLKAVYYKSCSICGEKSEDTFEFGELNPHNYDIDTWKFDEMNHWHICVNCGDKTDISKHISSGPATEDNMEFCTVCKYEIASALGHIHKLVLVEAAAATCTEDGHKDYYICEGCSKWFEDKENFVEIANHDSVIVKAAHKPSDWIIDKEATETEKGSKHIECMVCHTVIETQDIPVKLIEPIEPVTPIEPAELETTTSAIINQQTTSVQSSANNKVNNSVQTGDNNIISVFIIIALLSSVCVCFEFCAKKVKSK